MLSVSEHTVVFVTDDGIELCIQVVDRSQSRIQAHIRRQQISELSVRRAVICEKAFFCDDLDNIQTIQQPLAV